MVAAIVWPSSVLSQTSFALYFFPSSDEHVQNCAVTQHGAGAAAVSVTAIVPLL